MSNATRCGRPVDDAYPRDGYAMATAYGRAEATGTAIPLSTRTLAVLE
jgi:hypothetical protein